jgi:4-hydroxy-3-methylbut-2-en-1-yl diphosphate synthase IspG/GcpE
MWREMSVSLKIMKAKKLTLKQVQAVRCPTCGAAPGEKCELTTGQPRTEPHRDRRLNAEDERRT